VILFARALRSSGSPDGLRSQKGHVAIDEAHRAVGDQRLLELLPLTKGEALAAWSLKVRPLLDDDRSGRLAERVFGASCGA
jgi:hypothetical protein